MSIDEVKVDSFDFEVFDGINGVVCIFLVMLLNIDNKKLVLIYWKFVVNEGESILIIFFELCVDD